MADDDILLDFDPVAAGRSPNSRPASSSMASAASAAPQVAPAPGAPPRFMNESMVKDAQLARDLQRMQQEELDARLAHKLKMEQEDMEMARKLDESLAAPTPARAAAHAPAPQPLLSQPSPSRPPSSSTTFPIHPVASPSSSQPQSMAYALPHQTAATATPLIQLNTPSTPARITPAPAPSQQSQPQISAMPTAETASSAAISEFQPYLRNYALLMELRLMKTADGLNGVYMMPSPSSLQRWDGIVFPHNGKYRGGAFRFHLTIPDSFPNACPLMQFDSDVFHPQVASPSRSVDLSRAFPVWCPSVNHLWEIALYVKRLFTHIETDHATNKEAVAYLASSEPSFDAKVRACITDSREALTFPSPSDSYLRFSVDFPDDKLEMAMDAIRSQRSLRSFDAPARSPSNAQPAASLVSSLWSGLFQQ